MVDTPHDVESPGDLSDAATATLLRIIAGLLVACVVVVATVGITRWATGASREEPLDEVDIGFFQDMIDHHLQAILIANTYLEHNAEGGAAPYAREVPMFQGFEIERMDKWLAGADQGRGAPERTAMAWMGMSTTVPEMPGMQTAARLAELAAARGPDADRLYFDIMSDHHLGGVHMAEYAGQHANNATTRDFAAKMAYNQQIEVVEYEMAAKRLGL